MTDKKQDAHAELMNLVHKFGVALSSRLAAGSSKAFDDVDAFARTLTDRIAELEAQLDAVGAGGVTALIPNAALKVAPTVEPFGYFKPEPFGWTDCAETDEGAIALYTSPPPHQIAEPASHAVKDVLAERQRQINVEGWTPELDDDRVDGQMAGAASCYAQHVNARSWVATDLDNGPEIYRTEPTPDNWPWDESWWKPTTPRRDAVKACALLLAEIERIDRATNHKEPS